MAAFARSTHGVSFTIDPWTALVKGSVQNEASDRHLIGREVGGASCEPPSSFPYSVLGCPPTFIVVLIQLRARVPSHEVQPMTILRAVLEAAKGNPDKMPKQIHFSGAPKRRRWT